MKRFPGSVDSLNSLVENGMCPYCEVVCSIQHFERSVDITVRGEEFSVTELVHRCDSCSGEFSTSSDPIDPVDEAFSLYRKKHGMLSPSEIRELRKRYGLTQKELSLLLGWGAVTLSRYENGALQDMAHDRLLQAAATPDGLKKLIQLNPTAIDPVKRERLVEVLDSQVGLHSTEGAGADPAVDDSNALPVVGNGVEKICGSGQRLEADPLFLVEYMKATITSDIFSVMEKESISVSELAGRLGKSRQYVSRVLNETANFTLNSVARIAAALEKDVVLRLVDYDDEVVIRPFVKQEGREDGDGSSCSGAEEVVG